MQTVQSHSKVTEHSSVKGLHVAVLHGGFSREKALSTISAKNVISGLLTLGYKVTDIECGLDFAQVLLKVKPDVAYNCFVGTFGEDGGAATMLNYLNIPYTHSGPKSGAICFHKDITRRLCAEHGILTPKGEVVTKANPQTSISIPYVIKPTAEGSSISVEVVFPEDSRSIKDYAFHCSNEALVEEYIKGREIQVAVLNGKALGMLEVRATKNRFYDYEAKYVSGMSEHLSCDDIEPEIKNKIISIAEEAYRVLCCRGIARVEVIYVPMSQDVYFIEINTHPCFTPTSTYQEIAENSGMNLSELLKIIVESARCDT